MTAMIEAFDKAMAVMAKERSDMEDAAFEAYRWGEEMKRLLMMTASELVKTDRFRDWICTTELRWDQLRETKLFKECGEDVVLVSAWLEEVGR